MVWLPPGAPIHVLGMDIGYGVTSQSVWQAIAKKMHARLAAWGRVRLSLHARVMVLKTMAYSTVWYLGSLWDCPDDIVNLLQQISRYYFWKGRMPIGIVPGENKTDYTCAQGVAAIWLAHDKTDGGVGFWEVRHQLDAMRAQWVQRMLKPAGPNEALWRVLPLYWAGEALGVTTAADCILVADKPIETSPMVVPAEGRLVPPQWRATFRSFGRVANSLDASTEPATAADVLAQPLFHNVRLPAGNGQPLATSWTECVKGRWQSWAAAGIERVEDLYAIDGAQCTLRTLEELQTRADIHAEMAGLPGATVGSVIAVRPERHADDDTTAPGYSLPLWLAKVMTAVNAHGCKIQWYEGDYTAGRVELGDVGRAWKGSLVVVVRHTAPTNNTLALTASERGRIARAVELPPRHRYPKARLTQTDLNALIQALCKARWTHFLAAALPKPAAGDWFVDGTTATNALPMTVYVLIAGQAGEYAMVKWTQRGAGYVANERSTRRRTTTMTPIVMIDSSTNERMTGSWSKTSGSALRVLGFGGCRLQMAKVYANYKVSDGRQRLQGGEPGTVIQPIRATATAFGLTEVDARQAIATAETGHWKPAVKNYWWRNIAGANGRPYGDTVRPCECCMQNDMAVTEWTVRHVMADCPSWHMLWKWCQTACRSTKAAVPSTVTRPEWLLFGAGITPGTQKAQTATAIWGAALHAMQLLTYRLREEGETFTPATAVLVAQRRLIQAATADYWWVENQTEWLRGGGTTASPTRVATRTAWDRKWSGLMKRAPHTAAGHEAAEGGALSERWSVTQAAASA